MSMCPEEMRGEGITQFQLRVKGPFSPSPAPRTVPASLTLQPSLFCDQQPTSRSVLLLGEVPHEREGTAAKGETGRVFSCLGVKNRVLF